jgi:hypothetical protein
MTVNSTTASNDTYATDGGKEIYNNARQSYTGERKRPDRSYFPKEDINLPAHTWVAFNSRWEATYGNVGGGPELASGHKKTEVLDKLIMLMPVTRREFGENNYSLFIDRWYRSPTGDGIVPANQQSFMTREQSCFNDYLVASRDNDILDFLNWAKRDYVTAFVNEWVANRKDNGPDGKRMFSDIYYQTRRAFTVVNTWRVLESLAGMAETGHIYCGQVCAREMGVMVRQQLTKKRKFYQFITERDIEALNNSIYVQDLEQPLVYDETKAGQFVDKNIQAAFRKLDLERSLLTPNPDRPNLSIVSPYLELETIQFHFNFAKTLRGASPELTLGQGVTETVDAELVSA